MDIADFIERNWDVFSGAPMFVVIWAGIVASVTWWAASRYYRSRYDSIVAIADERGRLYEAKLNVGSPDEAAAKLADLERQLGTERAARTGELTAAQMAAVQQAAQPYHGKILIVAPMSNHTSETLSLSLEKAFRSAGWDAVMSYGDNGDGLGIPRLYMIDRDNPSPVEQAAKAALDAAGIRVVAQTHYAPPADRRMWLKL